MKKIVSLCLAALTAALLALPAFAAAEVGKMTVRSELEDPIRGKTFTASLELNRNPGITSLRAAVTYDKTVLELISVQDKKLLPSFSEDRSEDGKAVFHWKAPDGSGDLTAGGVLVGLTFRIRDDAPFGDSRVTVDFSDLLFDAQNQSGRSVAFDIKAFDFTLVCPHNSTETETVTPATFAEAGVGKTLCADCGATWDSVILPEMLSEDKKSLAVVQAGEFTDEGEKSLRTEYLFGGEKAEEAKTLFGDSVIRAFQVHFTREGKSYFPEGETRITLKTEFEKPENFGLYLVCDGGAAKVDADWEGEELSFLYGEGYFVLVARETVSASPWPGDTGEETPTVTEAPAVTQSPEEAAKEKEIRLILLGVIGLVLCGVGAAIVLRRGKAF